MTDLKGSARDTVDRFASALIELSHDVHAHPETNYEEHYSSDRVATELEKAGFDVLRNAADLPTAFTATVGTGALRVAICAEYDALPKVGHACGHNIIASAAVGAALALQPLVDELGLTIVVMGTPAEEGGGGKILMMQGGVFDGVNAAVMVHAAALERDALSTLATGQLGVEYFGKSAHAAAAPDKGISASAALALAQSGIAMLREHLQPGDRVHGTVSDGGGAPNVVPAYASGAWFVRGRTIERKNELQARIYDIFRGAALMTGCSLKISRTAMNFADLKTDERMAAHWRDNAKTLGRESLPIQSDDGFASTDMGNVSHAVPSIHPLIALDSDGFNIHTPEFEKFAAAETGDRAVLDGAKALAMTVIDMATDDELRKDLLSFAYDISKVDPEEPYLDRHWQDVVEFDPKSI